ncbi:MAG: hypothetical protein K6E54_06430 [Bacteroidaceae bacterium]|nr:hypothetical protein [Bacteroidaceae bacterium]
MKKYITPEVNVRSNKLRASILAGSSVATGKHNVSSVKGLDAGETLSGAGTNGAITFGSTSSAY